MKKKPVGIAMPSASTIAKMRAASKKRKQQRQKAAAGGSGMAAGIAKTKRTMAGRKKKAGLFTGGPAKPKAKPRKNRPLGRMPVPKRRS
tara:strand:- start:20 stop:286 length:267 start_codon:yes stop_codon:yes gene_type:complete